MEQAPADPQDAAAGARCAVHPERPAHAVCRRCGNYMCQACSASGHFVRCPGCRARAGPGSFPFTRDGWTFDGLVGHCFATWRENAVTLGLGTLIFFSFAFGVGFVGTLAQALVPDDEVPGLVVAGMAQIVQTLVQVGMQVGFVAMCFDAVQGRPPDLANLLTGFRKLPAALLQLVVFYGVAGGVGGVVLGVAWLVAGEDWFATEALIVYGVAAALLLVPAFYAALGVAFAMFELARDPHASGLGAIVTSWRAVSGHRWSVLGMGIVSGILSVIGMIACCVGMLVSYPLGIMLMCSLYLALGNTTPPEAPAPAPEPEPSDA